MSSWLGERLQDLRAQSLYRKLRRLDSPQGAMVEIDGRRLINFSSNDYLGFANEPALREAAVAATIKWGVGSGASRLVSGTQAPHLLLEESIARWKGAEAAITFGSGYAAAVGTIPALLSRGDVAVADKLCHASLLDGVRLSGALLRVFPHNNLELLEDHLAWTREKHPGARVLILTESVFSMDGDTAPLLEIIELKNRFGAMLMLDEAHAAGIIGPAGRGLAAAAKAEDQVDVQMGTLSKALGVSGGYICGRKDLIEWLINRARSFIFSTAPPAALAETAAAAVGLLQSSSGEERRQTLKRNIGLMSEVLGQRKAALERSAIFPWMVGDEKEAMDMADRLMEAGFLGPAIRYPTVGKGKARLRLTVTASHEEAQIRSLGEALRP